MATCDSPVKDPSSTKKQQQQQQSPLKLETPPPPPPPPDSAPLSTSSDFILLPSYASWFSLNNIHDSEVRFLPEFFHSRSSSKSPRVYIYLRNSIVKKFRQSPSKKITFTDVRKILVADVGSIRRVFDFLEAWGLINYTPSVLNRPLKWDDRDTKSSTASSDSSALKEPSKTLCSGCKSICTIACFACDKFDLTLCARCYVRGNYRVGVNSSDFRRVEINEESGTNWTDKETLYLLEGLMHYGDNWRKVAQHVGRTDKECVAHFVKLPLGEQFVGYSDSGNIDNKYVMEKDHASADLKLESSGASLPSKRIRLSPLADASNPIMAQAAFLSSLVGVEAAEAAACAAVNKLSDMGFEGSIESVITGSRNTEEPGNRGNDVASCGGSNNAMSTFERSLVDANSESKKEELDVERAISQIVDVQMKEMVDKLARFEELDLQMEKEHQQLDQMKSMLFVDQLNLLFHKNCIPETIGDKDDQNMRTC